MGRGAIPLVFPGLNQYTRIVDHPVDGRGNICRVSIFRCRIVECTIDRSVVLGIFLQRNRLKLTLLFPALGLL